MAESGSFSAKIGLSLINCKEVTPFNDTVDVGNLRGTTSFAITVSDKTGCGATPNSSSDGCVDISTDCGRKPKLIIIRPQSVRFCIPNPDDKATTKWVNGDWLDISTANVLADDLAKYLSFKSPTTPSVALGRPQFYFDGLIYMLLGLQPKINTWTPTYCSSMTSSSSSSSVGSPSGGSSSSSATSMSSMSTKSENGPIRLTFSFTEFWYDKDGKVTTCIDTVVRKLNSVIVQFIAVYGTSM